MMNEEHDPDLKRRFDAWRGNELPRAPEFERVWRRAGRWGEMRKPLRAPRVWLRLASVGVAVLAVIAGVLFTRDSSRPRPVITDADHADASSSLTRDEPAASQSPAWTAPTDFLLAAGTDDPVGQIADEVTALLRP